MSCGLEEGDGSSRSAAGARGLRVGIASGFDHFGAHQLPLGDGRLVDQVLLGGGLWLILGLESGEDLVKVFAILAGQNNGAGAEAVVQRIHGSRGLTRACFWTRGLACIA